VDTYNIPTGAGAGWFGQISTQSLVVLPEGFLTVIVQGFSCDKECLAGLQPCDIFLVTKPLEKGLG